MAGSMRTESATGKRHFSASLYDPSDLQLGVDDLTVLSNLSEEIINKSLEVRFKKGKIYTYIGSILVSVNPYRPTGLFREMTMLKYHGQTFGTLEPHLFAIAEAIYSAFCSDRTCQSVVISGESGAGKTETTKYMLQFLCKVSGSNEKSRWIEQQILEANTIMEAFGNARTVRNDNSSRFGKFIRVCFDLTSNMPLITGCILEDYLLEQSRIISPSLNERSYHVFYQFLNACKSNPEMALAHKVLGGPDRYKYLSCSNCYTIEGQNELAMFDRLKVAMGILGISQETFEELLDVLSAVLLFGNIEFAINDDDSVRLSDESAFILRNLLLLLGIKAENCLPLFKYRSIVVRGTEMQIPFKVHEAVENRDSMAKALYSVMFSWIIETIRECTNPGEQSTLFIGILDIFGFEQMDTNSFEQLCINYANEKLHLFFNNYVFSVEQELYRIEGIDVDNVHFNDNSACLDLIDRSSQCVLKIIDEESRFPNGTDVSLVRKLHSMLSSHEKYIMGDDFRRHEIEFGIQHYAGAITYTVAGFLDKNRNVEQDSFFLCLEESDKPISKGIAQLYEQQKFGGAGADRATMRTTKSKQTVSSKFKKQLKELVLLLDSTKSWYIRCLKPNDNKKPDVYDSELVEKQLRYLGMLDIIRIKKDGYPVHLKPETFVDMYWYLLKDRSLLRSSPNDYDGLIPQIMHIASARAGEWQRGKTQLFIKGRLADSLVDKTFRLLAVNATVIQKVGRMYIARSRFLKMKHSVGVLEHYFRGVLDRIRFLKKMWAVGMLHRFAKIIFAKNIANKLRAERDRKIEVPVPPKIEVSDDVIKMRRFSQKIDANLVALEISGTEINIDRLINNIDIEREETPNYSNLINEVDNLLDGLENFDEKPVNKASLSSPLKREPSKSLEDIFNVDLDSELDKKPALPPKPQHKPKVAPIIPEENNDLDDALKLLEDELKSITADPDVTLDDTSHDYFSNYVDFEIGASSQLQKQQSISMKRSITRQGTITRPEDILIPDFGELLKLKETNEEPDYEEPSSPVGQEQYVDVSGSSMTLDSGIASMDEIIEDKPIEKPEMKQIEHLEGFKLVDYAIEYFVDMPLEVSGSSGFAGTLSKAFKKKGNAKFISKEELFYSMLEMPNIPQPLHELDTDEQFAAARTIYKELYKMITTDLRVEPIQTSLGTILKLDIKDEIICQLVRLSHFPKPTVQKKVWQLLNIFLVICTPSKRLRNYVRMFVKEALAEPLFQTYARSCMDLLLTVRYSERKCPPSMTEIKAIVGRGLIPSQFYLADGRCMRGGIEPLFTTHNMLEKLGQMLSLQSTVGWAIYESSVQAEVYIRSQSCLADYIYKWEREEADFAKKKKKHKFVKKKFIILKRVFKDLEFISDPVEYELIFIQVVRSIVELDEFAVSEHQALTLAGLQAQAMYGPYQEYERLTRYRNFHQFLPKRIINLYKKIDWSLRIADQHKSVSQQVTQQNARILYLKVCTQFPMFGCAFYPVIYRGFWDHAKEVTLAVSRDGIQFLRTDDKKRILAYDYERIEGLFIDEEEDSITFKLDDKGKPGEQRTFEIESEYREDITAIVNAYCSRLSYLKSKKKVDLLRKGSLRDEGRQKLMKTITEIRQKLFDTKKDDKYLLNHKLIEEEMSTNQVAKTGTLKSKKSKRVVKKPILTTPGSVVSNTFWMWRKYPLQETLLENDDSRYYELASRMFVSILIYCGIFKDEKEALESVDPSKPIEIIKIIINTCYNRPDLVDELYLQLMKQITEPFDNKDIKIFEIIASVANTLVPSNELVKAYVDCTLRLLSSGSSEVGRYAQYALKCLSKSVEIEKRTRAPSALEIQFTCKCKPVSLKVHFSDNASRKIEFESWASGETVVKQIMDKIALSGIFHGYALYEIIKMQPETAETLIMPHQKVCDLLVKWELLNVKTVPVCYLAFKRRLFVNAKQSVTMDVEASLLFHQALSDIYNSKFPILPIEAIQFIAYLAALKARDSKNKGIGDHAEYTNLINQRLPKSLHGDISLEQIEAVHREIYESRDNDFVISNADVVNLMQNFTTWGMSVFEVQNMYSSTLDKKLLLGVDENGLSVFTIKSLVKVDDIPFESISEFNPSLHSVMIVTKDERKFVFQTTLGKIIGQLVTDYGETLHKAKSLKFDWLS